MLKSNELYTTEAALVDPFESPSLKVFATEPSLKKIRPLKSEPGETNHANIGIRTP